MAIKTAAITLSALILGGLLLALPATSNAGEIRVAAASNFRDAMLALVQRFEQDSGHSVVPVFGSTGKHFAQISHGAPFDAYFAADSRRPELLERNGLAVAGSRFTYAVGKLVLWSPARDYVDSRGDILRSGDYRHLAIANPDLAPYGKAAKQALETLGLWSTLENRLVRGENIGQAYQFVHSGNAELGLVAWSQLQGSADSNIGSYWLVPETLHNPIEQQAVLINDTPACRAFMKFIRSDTGVRIIRGHGYELP